MRFFIVAIATFFAIAANVSAAERHVQFFNVFDCPDRGHTSLCLLGKLPRGAVVTIIAKNWKTSAEAIGTLPYDDAHDEFKTVTTLRTNAKPPASAVMIAVTATTNAVELIHQREIHSDNISRRVAQFLRKTRDIDSSGFKYNIKTRILKVSPEIMLAEAKLTSRIEATDPSTQETIAVCEHCGDDTVPLMVGANLVDLFAAVRTADDHHCGGIVSTFRLFGRTHVLSNALSCESDTYSYTLVHDLSGKSPKLVFR
jgi:hypothetical protein